MLDRTNDTAPRKVVIFRHALVTRLTHWLNVFCLGFLLLSGLQIFNAHPALYWGQYGGDGDTPALSIEAVEEEDSLRGVFRIGSVELPTTGVLGVSNVDGAPTERAFPAWATLPSYKDLGAARGWHFLFAWIFMLNGAVYLLRGLFSGHLWRDLVPTRRQLSPRPLLREVIDHARLRFPEGDEARHYNTLQKLTYLLVVAVLLPLMLLTGICMSPGLNAVLPWLPDLFGGRPSARTIHFITASLLVGFVIVHVAMVMLSGPVNNMRSMITGRFAIRYRGPKP